MINAQANLNPTSTEQQGGIQDTYRWFQKAFPTVVSKNVHTQIGVHFEEVVEMLEELGSNDEHTTDLLIAAQTALHALAEHLKESDNVLGVVHRKRLLDSLCDQVVTATGVAYMQGFRFVEAMDEVNASNYSKFVNGEPVYKANLKLAKGPDFFEPNLLPFI